MSYRVLLADDELHILRAAEYKLKREGYSVVCANDGQEAWELLEERPVDLLVTDYQMPRLSGVELVKRMREREEFKLVPVIMLTAKGFELPHREMAEKFGVIEILDKPFSPRELCNHVQVAIEEAHRRRDLQSAPSP